MQKFFWVFPIFVFLFAVLTYVHALDISQYFISGEVDPCLTSGGNPKACDPAKPEEAAVLSAVEDLRAEWMSASQGVCSEAMIGGNFLDGNIIEFTANDQKISASVTLRDLNLDDIDSPTSLGTKATTQGNLTTSTTSVMQDSAPKPLSLATLPYWTENAGSNAANSRNGVLFEFFDENENPLEVNGFGAWFGDLETRSDVLPAFMRTYDRNGEALSENILINEDENTDLNQCGTTSGTGKGCGNRTTRWIGFSDVQPASVQKLLIVVGEDDLGSDGSREHLSFTGSTVSVLSNCPATPTPTSTPEPTSTPVISNTPEPTATPVPTEVQPTLTILPTNRVRTTTTPKVSPVRNTPTPSLTPTARHRSTPPFTPVATRAPKLPPVCKRPAKYIIQNRIWKEIQRVKLSEKYKLIHINLKSWK